MRYLFRGLRRETGEPVEGRVTAPDEDVAYELLGGRDIVVESLGREGDGMTTPATPLFDNTLEAALAEVGLRIRFDQLAHRYDGRSIWILERDRIPARVMQLVHEVTGCDDSREPARRRIADLLEATFGGGGRPAPGTGRSVESLTLAAEVTRLTEAMRMLERAMKSMPVAASRSPRRVRPVRTRHDKARDEVLREILESNLELLSGLPDGATRSVA